MTFIWLLVWLAYGSPHITFSPWNDWAVGLAVCAGLDLFGGSGYYNRNRGGD